VISDNGEFNMNNNFTVFIVDDSPDITELIKVQLELSNIDLDIVIFNNPIKGLAYLKTGNSPDVIITDYNMGTVNGGQILKASPFDALKILITANIDASTRRDILDLGVSIFEKPLSMKGILNEIKKHSSRLVSVK
jgi:DNA-binding response OmpR family regulator